MTPERIAELREIADSDDDNRQYLVAEFLTEIDRLRELLEIERKLSQMSERELAKERDAALRSLAEARLCLSSVRAQRRAMGEELKVAKKVIAAFRALAGGHKWQCEFNPCTCGWTEIDGALRAYDAHIAARKPAEDIEPESGEGRG